MPTTTQPPDTTERDRTADCVQRPGHDTSSQLITEPDWSTELRTGPNWSTELKTGADWSTENGGGELCRGGEASVNDVRQAAEQFVAQWTGDSPAAVTDDGWYYCDPQGQIQGEM